MEHVKGVDILNNADESNIQWLFDAVEYNNHKEKTDIGFYHEFCWIYVDMQYGHDEKGEVIKYG